MRNTFEAMRLPSGCLRPVDDDFHGIVPGTSSRPIGKVDLVVYIGEDDNQRVEELTFEVADFESPYNCILGRPFLNKFMGVIHPAYGVMKIPGPKGPIKVQADLHQAVRCDSNALAMVGHFKADDNVKVKQVKAPAEQMAGSS